MSEEQEIYTSTPKKSNRGGKRTGAGRKPFSPTGRRTRRVFTASDPEWEKIVEKAAIEGHPNISEYIRSKVL